MAWAFLARRGSSTDVIWHSKAESRRATELRPAEQFEALGNEVKLGNWTQPGPHRIKASQHSMKKSIAT